MPIVGPTDLPGLWIVTGTYRDGLSLAPVIARAVAAGLLGDSGPQLPPEFRPLRPPASPWTRSAAIADATANTLAVAAEHETRLAGSGWSSYVAELVHERLTRVYGGWPDEFVLPPDLAGVAQEDGDELRRAIQAYVDAWRRG